MLIPFAGLVMYKIDLLQVDQAASLYGEALCVLHTDEPDLIVMVILIMDFKVCFHRHLIRWTTLHLTVS